MPWIWLLEIRQQNFDMTAKLTAMMVPEDIALLIKTHYGQDCRLIHYEERLYVRKNFEIKPWMIVTADDDLEIHPFPVSFAMKGALLHAFFWNDKPWGLIKEENFSP